MKYLSLFTLVLALALTGCDTVENQPEIDAAEAVDVLPFDEDDAVFAAKLAPEKRAKRRAIIEQIEYFERQMTKCEARPVNERYNEYFGCAIGNALRAIRIHRMINEARVFGRKREKALALRVEDRIEPMLKLAVQRQP